MGVRDLGSGNIVQRRESQGSSPPSHRTVEKWSSVWRRRTTKRGNGPASGDPG